MRVINLSQDNSAQVAQESFVGLEPSLVSHTSYHELSDVPVVEKDALEQLHSNLEMLSDLTGRLGFIMREVRYVLKA